MNTKVKCEWCCHTYIARLQCCPVCGCENVDFDEENKIPDEDIGEDFGEWEDLP